MRYEAREGIVKLNICGVLFLTPIRKESKNCSAFMPLDLFGTLIWNSIKKKKSSEEIYELFMKMNMSEEKAKEIVDGYIKRFVEQGYVIAAEE